jgi:MtN3 and saliva related transmembrane protein
LRFPKRPDRHATDAKHAVRNHMTSLFINVIGVAAGLCSMASFIPQIAKIIRTHDVEGVSLKMFGVTAMAFTLWTAYGVLHGSWPIAASNAICLALASIIIVLRFRYAG